MTGQHHLLLMLQREHLADNFFSAKVSFPVWHERSMGKQKHVLSFLLGSWRFIYCCQAVEGRNLRIVLARALNDYYTV